MKKLLNITEPFFPIIEINGTPFEMGYQHGVQLSNTIQKYLIWIEKLTQMSLGTLSDHAKKFIPLLKEFSPSYFEEMKGLAKGANLTIEEAALCQLRAEAVHKIDGGCTAFAIKGDATVDGNVIAGQNQDLSSEYTDISVIIKINPQKPVPKSILFTFAGQLGYAGMNDAGIAQFANSLYDFKWKSGISHYPLRRSFLEQTNTTDCLNIIQKTPICSAANVLIVDKQNNILDVEILPGKNQNDIIEEKSKVLIHTNHYLSKKYIKRQTELPDSPYRLNRMEYLINEKWGTIDTNVMKNILADHENNPSGICRHGGNDMHSISGYIAEPSKHLFHIRYGHGCTGTWKTFTI